MAKRRSSCAVRFLWIVAGLIVLVLVAGAVALPLVREGSDALGAGAERRVPRGADAARRRLCAGAAVDRPARHRGQSGALDAARASRPTADAARLGLLRPPDQLPRNAAPGTRRSTIEESQDRARACSSAARRARSTASARSGRPNTARRPSAPSSPPSDDARRALDFAYRDVLAAYRGVPRARRPRDRPIILAAHSQGSLHLMRLLRSGSRGAPEARADRRRLCDRLAGLDRRPTCRRSAFPPARGPDQAGCLLSWQSFAEPADPTPGHRRLRRVDRASAARRARDADALHQPAHRQRAAARRRADANLGTLIPNERFHRRATFAPRRGAGALRRRAASC